MEGGGGESRGEEENMKRKWKTFTSNINKFYEKKEKIIFFFDWVQDLLELFHSQHSYRDLK